MAREDDARGDVDSKKQRDPNWIVWALLAVAAGAAVFTATRERAATKALPSARPVASTTKAVASAVVGAAARIPAVAENVRPEALLQQTCAGKAAEDCGCRESAMLRALTLGAPDSALKIDASSAAVCRTAAAMQGLRAEGLARSGQVEQATALLPAVLALDARNASVPYVRSIAALKQGNAAEATREATRALDLSRGAPAHVALALASFQEGELDAAETSLRRALQASADDVDALYNLAVIDQRRNRYTAARTGYLRVLRIRPDHLDARANVALLALGVGAVEEARHHQKKLEEVAPSGDARVLKLANALSKTAPTELQVVKKK